MREIMAFAAGGALANTANASDQGNGLAAIIHLIAFAFFIGVWFWAVRQDRIDGASVTAHGEGK